LRVSATEKSEFLVVEGTYTTLTKKRTTADERVVIKRKKGCINNL